MTPAPELEWVKPPRQVRSQETLERLLEASEELLLARPFEEISVTQIVKRARSSVGAFYSRFADKEALLRCVLERFHAQAVATAEDALAPSRWDRASPGEFLESSTRFLIRVFRERRHLIVALEQRAARDPELAAMAERVGERVVAGLQELLKHRGESVGHPEPRTAMRLCIWLVMSALENRCVFAPQPIPSEGRLAKEIATMCLSYLDIEESQDRRLSVGA